MAMLKITRASMLRAAVGTLVTGAAARYVRMRTGATWCEEQQESAQLVSRSAVGWAG